MTVNITTRAGKGSALTFSEMDNNLLALKAAIEALQAAVGNGGGGGTVTPAPGAITFDPLVTRSGNVYTFTARRTANLSNAETRQIAVAGSTAYPPGATAADFGGTFPTATASFAAGSATALVTITSPNAQPE
jgi:hypothetical protein